MNELLTHRISQFASQTRRFASSLSLGEGGGRGNSCALRPRLLVYLSTRLLLTAYCLLLTVYCHAQEKTDEQRLSEFVSNINVFNHLYPQEKVYLHFDNTSYFKGDAIWFKAYVVTAENNTLSPLSRVLYAELLSPEGEIIETKKLKIEAGESQGAFILGEDLYAGYYEVRAYTRCMLNFGEQVAFSRVFPVYDMPKKVGDYTNKKMSIPGGLIEKKNVRKEEKSKEVNLNFFPEGGNLIQGLSNRVAFKVTDKAGRPLELTGSIYNSRGEEVTSFSSLHLGMGSFLLSPDGNKYEARAKYKNKEYKFELPKSNPAGYVMQVENMNPKVMSLQIAKTPDLPAQPLGITFACRGKVYGFDTFTVNEAGQYSVRLPKENLPSGVVQITLFTPQGEILAQRHAFVKNQIPTLPIQATKIDANFDPFSPITIDFEVKGENELPLETSFSLSVRDKETLEETNHSDNILTNLLLSSDLKGYIENPSYYFEADDNKHRYALDHLMLVQAWTRYDWKREAGIEKFEIKHGIEDRLMIEGRILSPGKAKPQEDVQVTMWMTSSTQSQQGKCLTDKEGKFNFALEEFIGSNDLTLVAQKRNKSGELKPLRSRIALDRDFSPQPLPYNYFETNPLEVVSQQQTPTSAPKVGTLQIEKIEFPEMRFNKNQEWGMMSYTLSEVEVAAKRSYRQRQMDIMLRDYVILQYDVVRDVDKYRDRGESETGSLLDFLVEMDPYFSFGDVPVEVVTDEGEVKTVMRQSLIYRGKAALLRLDGVDFDETTYNYGVNDLTIDEVEHVIVTMERTLGGGIAYYLNIFLNENVKARRNRVGIRDTYFEGYAYIPQFYAPDYSITTLPEPDVRRTLYWNPEVKTDNQGKARVEFYNNGTCKQVDISAEGISRNGTILLLEKKEE